MFGTLANSRFCGKKGESAKEEEREEKKGFGYFEKWMSLKESKRNWIKWIT